MSLKIATLNECYFSVLKVTVTMFDMGPSVREPKRTHPESRPYLRD